MFLRFSFVLFDSYFYIKLNFMILILKFGVFNWFKISNFASKIDGKVKENEFIIILNNAVVPFNTKIKIKAIFSHNKIFNKNSLNVRCR